MMQLLFSLMFMMVFSQPVISLSESAEPADRDSVESNFVLGIADLFWQSGVNYTSLDRMSFMVENGRYGYYGPQPVFLMNDIPFDPTFFGISFTQLFPEPLFRIDEIDFREGSGSKKGIGYSSGLIHFTSEPLKDGVSVFASGQYGHNGGEPGPWVFDPNRVSPNVERFGPWADAGISLKFGNWYARGTVRAHNNKNVDEFVQMRMINLRGFPQRNEFLSVENNTVLGVVETGIESRLFDVRLQAIQSESGDYLYFQPLAREVPTNLDSEQYSALGHFRLGNNTGIRALYQYGEKEMRYRRNRFEHDFGWHQADHSLRGSFYFQKSMYGADIGAEHRRTTTNADGLDNDRLNLTTLHFDQHADLTSSIRLGTISQISMIESRRSFRTKGRLSLKISDNWNTEIEGGYAELLPEISSPTDHWVLRGYTIYEQFGIEADLPGTIANNRKTIFSNRHDIQLAEGFSLEVDFLLMNHISMNIPFQQAEYDLPFSTMPGRYTLYDDQSGQRYRAMFGLSHSYNSVFSQQLSAWVNRTIDGDDVYKQYWRMIPEYLVQYSADFKPFPDTEINLRLQYRSVTFWPEFANLDGELNRSFHVQYPFTYFHFRNELPEHVNLNMSFSKWFWEQRLRLALTLKNLFNENFQTHPIGTREGFGYLVRLEMRF